MVLAQVLLQHLEKNLLRLTSTDPDGPGSCTLAARARRLLPGVKLLVLRLLSDNSWERPPPPSAAAAAAAAAALPGRGARGAAMPLRGGRPPSGPPGSGGRPSGAKAAAPEEGAAAEDGPGARTEALPVGDASTASACASVGCACFPVCAHSKQQRCDDERSRQMHPCLSAQQGTPGLPPHPPAPWVPHHCHGVVLLIAVAIHCLQVLFEAGVAGDLLLDVV